MRIRKVLVTAANPRQRTLPLQTLIDQNGESKSALQVVLEEDRRVVLQLVEHGAERRVSTALRYATLGRDIERGAHKPHNVPESEAVV